MSRGRSSTAGSDGDRFRAPGEVAGLIDFLDPAAWNSTRFLITLTSLADYAALDRLLTSDSLKACRISSNFACWS